MGTSVYPRARVAAEAAAADSPADAEVGLNHGH